MKKIVSVILIMCCIFLFSACMQKEETGIKQETSASNKIVYGEKYYLSNDCGLPEKERNYYLFQKDYLKVYYYGKYLGKVYHYTVTCKYEIMDEGTLAYFFDSVEYYDDHTAANISASSEYNGILLFSKNVIWSQAGKTYVRASYLENNLPNFGKDTGTDVNPKE